MFDDSTSVQVSRRIEAPAARIFDILANPRRHPDLDGSSEYTGEGKMLQGALSDDVITGVGDTFAIKMNFPEVGDYVMLNYVVEFEPDRRIGWEPAPGDEAASETADSPSAFPQGIVGVFSWSLTAQTPRSSPSSTTMHRRPRSCVRLRTTAKTGSAPWR
jgi:hypothetical protein